MTPLTLRHLKTYLNWDLGRGDGLGFQLMKMGLLLLAVVFASIAPLTTVLFVLIPFALIYSALNYWADCLDHAGLVANEDEIDASRNVLAPPLVKLLFFPRNDCFHLVHHLFPHVPARHLENAHATLTDDPIYQQKQNAMPSAGVVGEIEVAR